jgi:hypothetical protein
MPLKYLAISSIAFFLLIGCVSTTHQQAYASQPSVSQLQGECLARYKKFMEQTKCIEEGIASYGLPPSPYVQNYLAYMQSLQEKVQRKSLSESDARAKMTNKLTELRASEQDELAKLDQAESQRTGQSYDMLNRNKIPQLELPQTKTTLKSPTQTNCQMVGNKLNCVSQ